MQKARVRTESMVQRFAKKPISEGFDLWDCDYPFGALRLFIFKSETAPPFQLGPCLDAMAEISMQMGSDEDAAGQYTLAADKYRMINQPILSGLMKVKLTEVSGGAAAALEQLDAFLAEHDPQNNGGGSATDMRTRSGLARCHTYRASLLLALHDSEGEKDNNNDDVEKALAAIEAAKLGVTLGWDRVHTGYCVLGDACEAAGRLEEAKAAYQQAIEHCPRCLEALERLLGVMKDLGDSPQDRLSIVEQAVTAHPRATLLRQKAFILSETAGDAAALAFLEPLIEAPPLEEMESTDGTNSPTLATLLKARAAILADAGDLPGALKAAQAAVVANAGDEEAASIVADIMSAMASKQ